MGGRGRRRRPGRPGPRRGRRLVHPGPRPGRRPGPPGRRAGQPVGEVGRGRVPGRPSWRTRHDPSGRRAARSSGADATRVRAALATDRGTVRLGSFAADQLDIVEVAVTRADPDDLETRARLTALLAQSLGPADQAVRQRAAALEALDLARSSADPTLLARIAPNVLFLACGRRAPGAVRADLAAEATAIVDQMNDPHLAYLVHYAAHSSAVCAGDAEPAARYLADPCHRRGDRGAGDSWGVGILDGYTATMTGRLVEAEAVIGATLELGVEIGDPDASPPSPPRPTCSAPSPAATPSCSQSPAGDRGGAVRRAHLPHRPRHPLLRGRARRRGRAPPHDAIKGRVDPIPDDWVRSTTLNGLAILAISSTTSTAPPGCTRRSRRWPARCPTTGSPVRVPSRPTPASSPPCWAATKPPSSTSSMRWPRGGRSVRVYQAATQLALAQNRLRADGVLDAKGLGWLDHAEQPAPRTASPSGTSALLPFGRP